MTPRGAVRCSWARTELAIPYHDTEWGVPVTRRPHPLRVPDPGRGSGGALSWETILKKRDRYREAFDGFDPAKVARYGARKQAALLADPGIVRNRLKVAAAVTNARAFLTVQREFGSFDAYVWRFVGGGPDPERLEDR